MLTRLINKTPLANEKSNIYEIDNIDAHLINQITQSRFAGEGVFILEQLFMSDYKERYLITPSFDKFEGNVTEKDWYFKSEDISELTVFELLLDKPSFMPLDSKQFIDIFNSIASIPNVTVFSQVLICKRLDNWRENVIQQYTSYLSGNDYPVDSKIGLKIQGKVLNVLNKISNFNIKRDPIEDIEQKIFSHNYRFEFRFIVYEQKNVNNFIETIEKNIEKLQLFNEFSLKKAQNKRKMINFIEKREFQPELVNQMLSESEIYSLLSNKQVKIETSIPEKTVTKPTSLLKQLQNNYFNDAIKILPFEEKKNLTIDKVIVSHIQQAFTRVKISKEPLEVTSVERGSRLQKIEIKIPSDKNYTDIKKNIENIQAALGNDSLSLEIGDKPETVNLYIACDDTELIYLKGILDSSEFQEYAKNKVLPFVIGEDVVGKPLFACLNELRHLLIAGESGSGKSVFLNCLIISLILYVNPDELVLFMVDPKMVELTHYEGFPQVKEVITNMRKASSLLSSLTIEMDRRYEILSKAGYRDIMGYNKSAETKIPYVVVVVDEYADLVSTNPEVEDYINRLGAKARASGIHLVIATQRPSADILDGAIKANLPARISFKLEATSDYMTVFGKGFPFELLGRGDGCARIEGLPKHYQRFQSPVITLDDDVWKDVISDLKEVFKGIATTDIELTEVIQLSPLDQLKKIIAETGETKVSDLGRLMVIGNNRVKALMQDLVDEEWLIQLPNKRYQINVDEEELDKWRDKE